MRTIWLRLFTLTAMFAGAAASATAEPYREECPAGSYLTGFEGRAGDWINQIQLVCARWDAPLARLKAPFTMKAEEDTVGRSNGGNPKRADCPLGWFVDNTDRITWSDDKTPMLHSFLFTCRPPGELLRSYASFGSKSPIERPPGYDERVAPDTTCFPGKAATGIEGEHGEFVFSFALICVDPPKATPLAGAKVNDAAKAKTYNGKWAVSGTSRVGNDIVGAPGAAEPTTPSPAPMARTTSPTDVYRKTIDGKFVRTDNDRSHFLPEHTVWALLAKEGGWWKLELKNITFAPGGEGWVAAADLEQLH